MEPCSHHPRAHARRPGTGLCPTVGAGPAGRGGRLRCRVARRGHRPLRQQPGQQRRRQRRHDHAAADRRPAAAAPRQPAGVHPRHGRHAAQRFRQGEPVLPARLQPRPRHRLRHLGGRHAGEPAHPRARPGLHRPELRHPGADLARGLLERPVLRRDRRLRLGRRREDALHHPPEAEPRAGHAGRLRLPARAARRIAGARPRHRDLWPRIRARRRSLGRADELQEVERPAALHAAAG